jgi:IS5 family transposase
LTESRQRSGECCCAFPAQLHDTSGHAAIDAAFFDRENASKHYCRRTNYRVQTLKATALVDTESQAILDVHCTTEKRHNIQFGWQVTLRNAGDIASLAADKGYDWMDLREKLGEKGVSPLIKHRESGPSIRRYARDRWASVPPTSDVCDRLLHDQAHARRRRACANLVR